MQHSGGRAVVLLAVACLGLATVHAQPPATGGAEVTVDAREAPDLEPWADRAREICAAWYPRICAELDGATPPPARRFAIVFRGTLREPAAATEGMILLNPTYVRANPDDFGMVVHELVHLVQAYGPNRADMGWLVEGIADYIRFWQFEPRPPRAVLGATASYRDGYRTAAAFLAWLGERDARIVSKLHARLRAGDCDAGVFRTLLRADLDTLWREFVQTQNGAAPAVPPADTRRTPPDLTREPTLYVVGYSHLDTQWRWTYVDTIGRMIPRTMHDNFRLFELYPHYILNLGAANVHRLMQEYYPADFERVRAYVAAGRWFPCGSVVEECDLLATGAESVIRQLLYGSQFFRREFGQSSVELTLPDCFGFPASLPTLLAHGGLQAFDTQKLTWGSAVGIPFNVGVWEGVDGTGVLAALDPQSYTGTIRTDLSTDPAWLERVRKNGAASGLYVDYHYFGAGDEGGAPEEDSVKLLEASVAGSGPLRVVAATADQMFREIPAERVAGLPRYRGDLLLTEHSAGALTSQAYMKRWNRHNEVLADAAERAAVFAARLGGLEYPRARLQRAWGLVLGGQFHDILPGTCVPKAYEYSWNDELLALNQFADVLDSAVGALAGQLDTRATGVPLVVYNPLSIAREDIVEATVSLAGAATVRVLGPDGRAVPAQVLERAGDQVKLAFLAAVPAVGLAVFDVCAAAPAPVATTLAVHESGLENARYRVQLDGNGDVAGIYDKQLGRELLRGPARLAFQQENPAAWPAWNMDWADRQQPPRAFVAGPAAVRIVERGPARVALAITRAAEESQFVQTIRLAAGAAGERVEFCNRIDWQSRACSLKAVFPLTAGNPRATYSWGVGTVARGNNEPRQYEVPAHQWFDLTDADGGYGVTVLTDCKYGSDKPDDHTLRLTLLYTPGTRDAFPDQATQDWGRHEFVYGLAGHAGDWRAAQTDWQALGLNEPLRVFQTPPHDGPLGRACGLLEVNNPRVRVLAVKQAEESDEVIVRLVELDGRPARGVRMRLALPIAAAREVDGRELPRGPAQVEHGELVTELAGYGVRAFALQLAPASAAPRMESWPLELPFDRCVTSRDGEPAVDGLDAERCCIPAEMFPAELRHRGVRFALGTTAGNSPNAVTCRGQVLALPEQHANRLFLLAAAAERESVVTVAIDGQPATLSVQPWSGFIGAWDNRTWKPQVPPRDGDWPFVYTGVRPAFLQTDPVAWYCSHRHAADGANLIYEYSYLFAYVIDLSADARTVTLPQDEEVFVLAATAVYDPAPGTRPAAALADELARADAPPRPRITPETGRFDDATTIAITKPLFGSECMARYTLDGSDPGPDAPVYERDLVLAQSAVVRARLFDGGGRGGAVAEARLQIEDRHPPRVEEVMAFMWSPFVEIGFSEPLDATAARDVRHYRVPGNALRSAELAASGRRVVLELAGPPQDAQFQLILDGVQDRAPQGNALREQPQEVRCIQPVAEVEQLRSGAGGTTRPLGAAGPISATACWTVNMWVRVHERPGDFTLIAGFGSGEGDTGTQRYLAYFPHGVHFWGSNVDVPAQADLDLRRWQMLTATYDGRTLRLYKDGREVACSEVAFAPAAPEARVAPPPAWSYGHTFAGEVAGFTVWSQVLPPRVVETLHGRGPEWRHGDLR